MILVNKDSLFGLLRFKGVVRLGEISYSIYLLHGIVWFCFNQFVDAKTLNTITYLTESTMVLILIMLISSLTYKYIEIPFNNYGKRLKDKI